MGKEFARALQDERFIAVDSSRAAGGRGLSGGRGNSSRQNMPGGGGSMVSGQQVIGRSPAGTND